MPGNRYPYRACDASNNGLVVRDDTWVTVTGAWLCSSVSENLLVGQGHNPKVEITGGIICNAGSTIKEKSEPYSHHGLVVLRSAFRRDRKLLGELCRCAWQTLREYLEATLGPGYAPGAIFAIQTWGDQLNWHPHIHALLSDRAWTQDGVFSSFGGINSGRC